MPATVFQDFPAHAAWAERRSGRQRPVRGFRSLPFCSFLDLSWAGPRREGGPHSSRPSSPSSFSLARRFQGQNIAWRLRTRRGQESRPPSLARLLRAQEEALLASWPLLPPLAAASPRSSADGPQGRTLCPCRACPGHTALVMRGFLACSCLPRPSATGVGGPCREHWIRCSQGRGPLWGPLRHGNWSSSSFLPEALHSPPSLLTQYCPPDQGPGTRTLPRDGLPVPSVSLDTVFHASMSEGQWGAEGEARVGHHVLCLLRQASQPL